MASSPSPRGARSASPRVKPGETIDIAHYRLTFDGLFNRPGPNYRDVVGRFTVRRTNGDLLGVMEPSRRTFPSRNMATTEAALMRRGVSQLYLSLGDPNPDGSVPVRLYFKPLVLLIWLGARDHVCRRRAVAVRSAVAHRRAASRQGVGGVTGGGVSVVRALCPRELRMSLFAGFCLLLLSSTQLLAVELERDPH